MPINYLQRIKHYYQTLGYGKPYEWAHYEDVPFTKLNKPLQHSKVGIVTTAAPYQPDKGNQGPGAPYNSAAKFYTAYAQLVNDDVDARISHVGYDRVHTKAEDMASWLPVKALQAAADRGLIGSASEKFYGMPTNRSQVTTNERDCPALLNLLQQDQIDVVVLVPNCPVCHQCISMAARYLEQHGIATVVMACAKDIVEHVGVPRLLFSDFPLGNAAGKPHDTDSQQQTLEMALTLVRSALEPRTTKQSPIRWTDNDDWQRDFYNIDLLSEDQVNKLRAEFDQQKEVARKQRSNEGL